MGNCNLKADDSDTASSIHRQHFEFHLAIGKGGFGKVWNVTHKRSKHQFALKQMLKARILSKRSVNSVMNERRLLVFLRHDFIINIAYAFQDKDFLYLVLEYKRGGDLRYHLGRRRRFSELQTKFLVGCLLLALEYIHSNGVIHRDIKPENLVLDHEGYLHLTDFGIARLYQPENANETSGTPGYMAPEVLCRQNHTAAVDFFAIGVIVFEFMTGKRPYLGRNRKEIREAVLAKQIQLSTTETTSWSEESIDFCNRLIQRKPQDRLGFEGIHQLIQHPWFHGFDWEALKNKNAEPPFKPPRDDNFDSRHVNNEWRDQDALSSIKQSSLVGLFPGYFYDITQGNMQTTVIDSVKPTN